MRGNEHACLHEPALCSTSSIRTSSLASGMACADKGPRTPDKEIGARKSVSEKNFTIKVRFSSGRYKIECQRICIPTCRRGEEGRKGERERDDDRTCGFLTERNYLGALT